MIIVVKRSMFVNGFDHSTPSPFPIGFLCRAFSILIDLVSPALLPIGMPFRLPNALTSIFNRLALIPLQLKREPMPPKKRKPRRKRKKI